MNRLEKIIEKMNGKYEGRDIVISMQYGSHNYGTDDDTSDFDYKIFVMPTVDDLYNGKKFTSTVKIDGNDFEIHDIRKLISLFTKANPTYIELLQSQEYFINDKYKDFVADLFDMKEDIAVMNLKGYASATRGVAFQKLMAIFKDKPSKSSNEGYKRRMKFGFDTKQLLHCVRIMTMRKAVFIEGMTPLSTVDLRQDFPEDSVMFGLLDKLKDIKANKDNLTKEQALAYADTFFEDENAYLNPEGYPVIEETKTKLEALVKNLVLTELTK